MRDPAPTPRPCGLDELCRAAGPLGPAAVCRVGQRVARHLQELGRADGALGPARVRIDEDGEVTLAPAPGPGDGEQRFRSPERGAGGAATVADDLWALGLLLSDAAEGHPAPLSPEGAVVLDRARFPQRFVDALTVLVAPAGARLTNPGAAARIFFELEPRLGDGRAMLQHAVRRLRVSANAAPGASAPATIFDGEMPGPLEPPRAPSPAAPAPAATIDPPTIRDATADLPPSLGDLKPLRDTFDLDAAAVLPRTVEMGDSGKLPVEELRRVAALAEEAAARQRGGMPQSSAEPGEPSSPGAGSAGPVAVEQPEGEDEDLDDAAAAFGMRSRTKMVIAAAVGAVVVVGLAFLVGMALAG